MSYGLLALFFASAVGGLNPVIIKIGAREIPPLTLIAFRFFLATIIFLPFYYKKLRHLTRRDIMKLTLVASFFTLNVALFSTGIQYTTVIMSQILSMITPIIVGIFAIFIVNEKMQKEHIVGVGIALVGVGFLVSESLFGRGANTFGTPFGNMLIFLATIFWCLYITLSRRLIRRYSPMTVSFFTMAVAGVSLLFVGAPVELLLHPVSLHISWVSGGSITYLVFLATLLFFPLMQYAIKHTSAFTASLSSYISPLFGSSVAIVLLGERITQPFIIGTLFILCGVIYSTNIKYLKKYIPAMLEYIHD